MSVDPTLNVGETLVWRHSGPITPMRKRLSPEQLKHLNLAFLVFHLMSFLYSVSNLSTWGVSAKSLIIVALYILVLVLLPIICVRIYQKWQAGRHPEACGVATWMSNKRLAFLDGFGIENTVNLKDVHAATPDYVMGSPALVLASPKSTLKLLSSEIYQIQNKLFTLRPDLEPTS